MAFSSDRTVITSTNNTLSSKSAITKVGDTTYKEDEWPKVADLDDRQWSTVVANGNKNSKTRHKYHNKTLMRRKLKHGEKT